MLTNRLTSNMNLSVGPLGDRFEACIYFETPPGSVRHVDDDPDLAVKGALEKAYSRTDSGLRTAYSLTVCGSPDTEELGALPDILDAVGANIGSRGDPKSLGGGRLKMTLTFAVWDEVDVVGHFRKAMAGWQGPVTLTKGQDTVFAIEETPAPDFADGSWGGSDFAYSGCNPMGDDDGGPRR